MAVEVTDKDKVTRLLPEVSEVGTYVRAQVSLERDRATQTEQALSARISEEQEARKQSDVEIRESITKEESRAKGSEEQLAQSITAERARAEQAESELDSAISVEKGRAQQVESDLQTNLTSLSQDLRTEIARASNQEDALQVDIDNERSRAKGAESEIKNSVSAEISRATGVESGLDTRISGIEGKIPNQASASNQLADKDFVNSSINSSAAFYRGSFNTKADLDVWQTANPSVASNNDYAYVQADETHSNEAWRYIFVKAGAEQGQWQAQFRVNEAPLTSEQVAALNSGATKDLIDSIPHKLPINTEQTDFDEVYVKTAQGTQDSLPISKGADDDTIAMRGTGGTLKVGTPLVDKDAVPKDYAEKTFAGLNKQNSFTARNLFYKALEVYTSGGSEACKYDYGKIDYQVLEDGNLVTKTITLPKATGTMALLSDIPTNHVTTDTEQSITAMKTFIGNKLKVQSSSSVYAMYNATQVYLVSGDQTTAYNIDTISRSKGGDSGNTYFYTFPNKSGTFAMLSDIGVDTIYGYLQGTNGISIAKTQAGDKVEVKTPIKINETIISSFQQRETATVEFMPVPRDSTSRVVYTDYKFYKGSSESNQGFYNFKGFYLGDDDTTPISNLLYTGGPLGNVKTIGGQSIYGSGDIPISGGGSKYANTSEIVDNAITLTSTSTLDDLVTQILAQKTKVVRATWNSDFQRIIPLPTLPGPPDVFYDVYFKVWSDYPLVDAGADFERRIDCFATSGTTGSSSKWDYRGYICGAASKYFSGWVSEGNPYPVGAIYIAVATAGIEVYNNPANCFGGTWEYIEEGKFLLTATPPESGDPVGQAYPAGSTGGSADAVVVEHTHAFTNGGVAICANNTSNVELGIDGITTQPSGGAWSNIGSSPIASTGVDGTGKNLPPYLAVCMWRRVA